MNISPIEGRKRASFPPMLLKASIFTPRPCGHTALISPRPCSPPLTRGNGKCGTDFSRDRDDPSYWTGRALKPGRVSCAERALKFEIIFGGDSNHACGHQRRPQQSIAFVRAGVPLELERSIIENLPYSDDRGPGEPLSAKHQWAMTLWHCNLAKPGAKPRPSKATFDIT